MNLRKLLVSLCVSPLLLTAQTSFPSHKLYKPLNGIYHKGWIDFNKNGVKDIYEDPAQSIERRISDLLGLRARCTRCTFIPTAR